MAHVTYLGCDDSHPVPVDVQSGESLSTAGCFAFWYSSFCLWGRVHRVGFCHPQTLLFVHRISVMLTATASNQSLQPTALWRCAWMSILISAFSTVAQPRSQSGG